VVSFSLGLSTRVHKNLVLVKVFLELIVAHLVAILILPVALAVLLNAVIGQVGEDIVHIGGVD